MGQPVRAHTKQQWKGRQHEPQPIYPLRLYLIRHGETEWALTGPHTGRTDICRPKTARTKHGLLARTYEPFGLPMC